MSRWLFNVLIALDLLAAAICGCKRNETLSAAAYSLELDGKLMGRFWRPVIDFCFSFRQDDHCWAEYDFETRWNRNFNE